jgi:flagellar basal body-associated protein FliL
MADEQTATKPATGQTAKAGGGILGPLLGVVVILGIGVALGLFVANLLKQVQEAPAAKVEAKKESGPSLEALHEIALPDLISNVRNQQGRRYIKATCAIWVSKDDARKMGFSSGEGSKGGGAEVKRILQMTLEEHLKNYDLDELTGPNIYIQLKKGFQDQIEKALHDLYPDYPADHRFVDKVVLTNLLVQ